MASARRCEESRTTTRSSILAVLIALALAASACGTDSGQTSADAALGGDAADDGPQYGDSLEEWSEAIGADADSSSSDADLSGFASVEWEDLVPPGFSGDEIWARYEDRLAMVDDGSPEADAIYEEMQSEYDDGSVNAELDGQQIQLAGFVAPLRYEGDIVTEFLLVPYFGACIHVPPPPPNQTIMVTTDASDGLTVEDTWGAVWVAGTLTATSADTDLATAGYTISGALSGVYDDY